MFKLLESRFSDELQEAFWKLTGFANSQFGFLRHMSTQSQIYNLLQRTTSGWAKTDNSKLHKHIASCLPQIPKYDPLRNYLIFIDLKQAYNSVNMQLLFERMKRDKIIDEDKLIFLFGLYSRLKIQLGEENFNPNNGVPQGGINSPILFDFAMYYFLTDASERINLRIQLLDQLSITPKVMTRKGNFTWADDLASLLTVHRKKAKTWIKAYFTIMLEEGAKWGLHINYEKSAIMEMFSLKTNYNFLSDEKTTWTKNKGTSITLTLYPNGKKTKVILPVTPVYKYLGVKITRNLSGDTHIQTLKAKIEYITHAFTATRLASQDLKFCLNTWQLFIRPLLDYFQTYFSFLPVKDRTELETLYRQSVRKMLFMDRSTPTYLMDRLIQYDYRNIYKQFRQVAKLKAEARFTNNIKNPDLRIKVKFNYKKIDTSQVPLVWADIWNKLYSRGKKCKATYHNHSDNFKTNKDHILETLQEYNISNIIYELHSFINPIKIDNRKIYKLYEIHKLLLSIV